MGIKMGGIKMDRAKVMRRVQYLPSNESRDGMNLICWVTGSLTRSTTRRVESLIYD